MSSGLAYRPSGLPLQNPVPGAWVVVVVVVVGGVVVLAPGLGVVVEGSGGSSEWLKG